MEIEYIGEQLGYGIAGNLFVIFAFIGALLATLSYYLSFKTESSKTWRNYARFWYAVHSVSVISILILLVIMVFNHRFEYYYIWQHSSTTLPGYYILASIWEGQEGSFLLWMFWHIVLSWVLIRKAGFWEGPTMFVIAMVQVFLASMLLGVNVFGVNLGTNPFILLREHPEMMNLPFTKFPDYLDRLTDGRGLNPLLQNYWMVIHPPTLFLGFASTLIPFAFAIAGLLTKKVKEWIIPTIPWAFFGVMILSTGILMGAAWAYEALSFGGFWAWDPVENASLVPLLTFIGGAHLLLVYKKRQRSLLSSFILIIITFVLILYSTFLTRSGILGDTSVHAFTDLGMSGQLVVYMLVFTLMGIYLLIKNRKLIPKEKEDEHISSREFWMFIGTMVLVISCIQITFTTSIPVINTLFNTNFAPPEEVVDHYNSWQIPIAIIISILIAVAQFFKYQKTNSKKVIKHLVISAGISLLLAVALQFYFEFNRIQYSILAFASIFAVLANLDYMINIIKGKLIHSGSSIAHIGVGLILLGALISNAKSETISQNVLDVDLGKEFPNQENILLYKGDTVPMDKYHISYTGKEKEGSNIRYHVDYFERNFQDKSLKKAFTLSPVVQTNPTMGNVADPDTKHFIDKDIYTHITYADLETLNETGDPEDYQKARVDFYDKGDTIATSNALLTIQSINNLIVNNEYNLEKEDIAVSLKILVIGLGKQVKFAEPVFIVRSGRIETIPAEIEDLGLKIDFTNIKPEEGLELSISEKFKNKKEFIIMKAVVFPYINILWIGCILLVIGSWIAIVHRKRENKRLAT
ncbi:MAG: cytochrome c biogenesis protein CcsA [Bacteroidia bacterium]|nr:cytochrome c biogenesis protein CcsA [Bacteroidia bacterium]